MVRWLLILVWTVLLGAQGVPGLMVHAHAGMAMPGQVPVTAPVAMPEDGDAPPCHTAEGSQAPVPAPEAMPTPCDSAPAGGGCHCDCAHLPVGLPGIAAWLSPRPPAVEFRARLETDHPSAMVARDLRPPILLQR
jgi:hypothetical protein